MRLGVPRLCVPNSELGRLGAPPGASAVSSRGMGPLAYTNLFPNRSYPL